MTDIKFYLLNYGKKASFIIKLINKIYTSKRLLYIHANDSKQLFQIDKFIWNCKLESFLPHLTIQEDQFDYSKQLILLGHENKIPSNIKTDILLNLSDDIPIFFSNFKKVLQVVTNNELEKTLGRKAYSFYKQRGYSIDICNIGTIQKTVSGLKNVKLQLG